MLTFAGGSVHLRPRLSYDILSYGIRNTRLFDDC